MRKTLSGEWLLNSKLKGVNNLKVTVPGSIYNDLFLNNIIEEPYYRANEALMLDYMKYDYTYSRMFHVSEDDINKEVSLYFLGLDTITEIYVNDKLALKTYNMHRRYRVIINDYINEGDNKLSIVIKSCLDFIHEEYKKNTHELMNMGYAVKGYATIRKAHCMFGWDWGPQMPDGGIWRDLYLEIIDKGRIENVKVFQDTSSLESKLKVQVDNYLLKDDLKVKLSFKNDDYIYEESKFAKKENLFEFKVDNPKLWWPVGYGNQELYELKVELVDEDSTVDQDNELIGLRKMEVVREDDEFGTSFTVRVNNQDIFIKGSDYIIEDNILPRTSIERTKYLLNAVIEGNQNCLRIWGGALYPSNEFYTLCDKLGILIWQDLMFACGYYDMENKEFVEEIKEEIVDNVNRIHNHACIVLICGNNENETAANDWHIPEEEYTKKWYLYQYEELIPSILKDIAPDIFYWPSSPSSGGGFIEPNSDKKGDMHYWGVWHNDEPIENYRLYFPRMMSEFGMQSFPSIKTINEFTKAEDRNIYSYVMERHQKNRSANQKIINYIGSMFKYPKDLENISYISEVIQAEAVRYCVEHLRRNYPRCMGSIYWQLNDCWPVASWSSIDYYGRYKALQYYSKRFYSPVLLSIEESNTQSTDYLQNKGSQNANIYLTNETRDNIKGKCLVELLDFDGNLIDSSMSEIVVKPFSSNKLLTKTYTLSLDDQMNYVLRVRLYTDNNVYESNVSFVRDKYLNLKKPKIEYSLFKEDDLYILSLISNTFSKYVFIDLKDKDVIFSDNYFNMFKGETKIVTFKSKEEVKLDDIIVKDLTSSY